MNSFEGGPVQPAHAAVKQPERAPAPFPQPETERETGVANDLEYGERPPIVRSSPELDVPAPVPVHAPGYPFRVGEGVEVLPQALTTQEPANKPTLEPSLSESIMTGLRKIFKRKQN